MKQFAIIGIGNFGFYLATRLSNKGYGVMAIDKVQNLVQEIKGRVTQAVVADSTDRKVLESLGMNNMDAVVVCIGSNMSDSILTTLNLKEIGVHRVIAKALSEAHGRILEKVGANEILFPEKDMAISLAERLHNPNMIDYLPLMDDYSIIEVATPNGFIGKKLSELDLINRYGIQVVAIKEVVRDRFNMIPTAQFVLKQSDIMILLGPNDALDKLKGKE